MNRNLALMAISFSAALTMLSASSQAAIVYDNLAAPSVSSAATSSTDLTATYGDQMNLTSGGILEKFGFTIFNSSTGNTGTLDTAVVNLKFYDATNPYVSGALALPLLGQFNANINFGANPLNAGFFTTVSVSGLSSFNINLTQKLMVTQQVVSFTGTTTRLGVVTFTTENVGSSIGNNWYRKSLTNSPTEGLFGFASPTSNAMGYNIETVPEPATMILLAGAGVAALARRRNKKA